jgi:hypothetical protein
MIEVAGQAKTRELTRVIELCIFNVPPSANVLRRKYRNPHVYAKLRDSWGWILFATATLRERKELRDMGKGGKRVKVSVCVQHRQLFDRDNLFASVKPVLDSMVGLRWLKDDSEKEIQLEVVQSKGEPFKTTIRLEVI